MLVFSMGDRSSFEHLDKWMKECMEYSQTNKLPIVLLGNKVIYMCSWIPLHDLYTALPFPQCEEKKVVSAEEAQKWGRERGIQCVSRSYSVKGMPLEFCVCVRYLFADFSRFLREAGITCARVSQHFSILRWTWWNSGPGVAGLERRPVRRGSSDVSQKMPEPLPLPKGILF